MLYKEMVQQKHGQDGEFKGSMFQSSNLDSSQNLGEWRDLCIVLSEYLSADELSGNRLDKTITYPKGTVGTNRVIEITPEQRRVLPRQTIKRQDKSFREISTMYVERYRKTNKIQVKLVPYNPNFDPQNLVDSFNQKHPNIPDFDPSPESEDTWAILTVFPGNDAPPMGSNEFKNTYAFLEKLK